MTHSRTLGDFAIMGVIVVEKAVMNCFFFISI